MEAELRRWIAEHGDEARMPTQRELRASGAAALYDSISRLGGTKAFARRLRRTPGLHCKFPAPRWLLHMTRLKQSLLERYSKACARRQRAVFLRQAANIGMLICVGGGELQAAAFRSRPPGLGLLGGL